MTECRQKAVLDCVSVAKRYRDAYQDGQTEDWQTAPKAAEICGYFARVIDDIISDMEKLLVKKVAHDRR